MLWTTAQASALAHATAHARANVDVVARTSKHTRVQSSSSEAKLVHIMNASRADAQNLPSDGRAIRVTEGSRRVSFLSWKQHTGQSTRLSRSRGVRQVGERGEVRSTAHAGNLFDALSYVRHARAQARGIHYSSQCTVTLTRATWPRSSTALSSWRPEGAAHSSVFPGATVPSTSAPANHVTD